MRPKINKFDQGTVLQLVFHAHQIAVVPGPFVPRPRGLRHALKLPIAETSPQPKNLEGHPCGDCA